MTYEAWRISYQSSEQAARAAYEECAQLRAKVEAMERLEAAEKEVESWKGLAKQFSNEADALRAKIETAENDTAHQKALAASALRVAEGWERKCDALRAENAGLVDDMNLLRDNNTALRARIEAMENQEPIATVRINVINGNPSSLSDLRSRRTAYRQAGFHDVKNNRHFRAESAFFA